MFKKIGCIALLALVTSSLHAQVNTDSTDDNEPEIILGRNNPNSKENAQILDNQRNQINTKGPKKWFSGGALNLGFGSGGSNIGVMPVLGYSPNKYVDLGFELNYSYTSYSADYSWTGYKQKFSNFGLGPWARVYPIDFLFIQGQFQQNWVNYSSGSDKENHSVQSLLGYIGYSNRVANSGSYFFMVGMDFLQNQYSPYRQYDYTDNAGKVHTKPIAIVRAGFNFYLW